MYEPKYKPANGNLARLKSLTKELHKKEEELVTAKELIDAFFDSSIDLIILVLNKNGFIVRASKSVQKHFGWFPTEIENKHYSDITAMKDAESASEEFSKIRDKEQDANNIITSWKCKDGTSKRVIWYTPSFNGKRSLVCSIGIVQES